MRVLIILVCILAFNSPLVCTAKEAPNCASFENPLVRLKCYDDVAKSPNVATIRGVFFEIIESPPAVAAIVAALLALISGIAGPLVQLSIGKRQAKAAQTSSDAAMLTAKNAGNREIARLRISWMDKLRDTLAEYHSILMSQKDTETKENTQKLSQLGTQLDLLLNQDDRIQKDLWDIADKIYQARSLLERQSYDADLIKAGRAVFKAEWEKIKEEMQGEGFQTGE
jgi:hypothetical protein